MKTEENRTNSALLRRLVDALDADPRILAAYVHGSFGRASFRGDSDLDCALLLYPGQTMSATERLHLAGELSGRLAIPVDMGELTTRNLIYFVESVHNGQRILCRSDSLADALVGRAFSLYARLKEDRREVEASYYAA